MESKVEGSRKKTGGRVAGTPNKATKQAREAFAGLVDGNAHKFEEWLESIANGIPLTDKEGNIVYKNDIPVYIVQPSPKDALDMVQKIAEYHIPKLARTEVTEHQTGEVTHIFKFKD